MSIDQARQVTEIMKIVMYIAVSIASFLMVSTYNSASDKLDSIDDKIDSVEKRLIRVEYEMKLK